MDCSGKFAEYGWIGARPLHLPSQFRPENACVLVDGHLCTTNTPDAGGQIKMPGNSFPNDKIRRGRNRIEPYFSKHPQRPMWRAEVTRINGSCPTIFLINRACSRVSLEPDSNTICDPGTPMYCAAVAISLAAAMACNPDPPESRSLLSGICRWIRTPSDRRAGRHFQLQQHQNCGLQCFLWPSLEPF